MTERAVLRRRNGRLGRGGEVMCRMIVLNWNRVTCRVVPRRVAPVEGGAAHQYSKERGNDPHLHPVVQKHHSQGFVGSTLAGSI